MSVVGIKNSRQRTEDGVTLVEAAISTLTFYSIVLFVIAEAILMNQVSSVTQQALIGPFNGVTDRSVAVPAPATLFSPAIADAATKLDQANIDTSKDILKIMTSTALGLSTSAVTASVAADVQAIPAGYRQAQSAAIDISDADYNQYQINRLVKLSFLPGFSEKVFTISAATRMKGPSSAGTEIRHCVARYLSKNSLIQCGA